MVRTIQVAPPPPRPNRFRWDTIGVSRLALQIIVLKLIGLSLLLWATLAQLSLRDHAADAALEAVAVQADTIAALLSGGAGAPLATTARVPADPNSPNAAPAMRTVIDRDLVERLVIGITEGSAAEARVFGIDGARLADSRFALMTSLDVTAGPLPPLAPGPTAREPQEGLPQTVESALGGVKNAARRQVDGDLVVSVAAPVLGPAGEVIGAVEVTSGRGTVVAKVRAQELAVMKGFAVAAVIAVVLSLLLAALINRPLARLANAAERVKMGAGASALPELSRTDTIGQLARSFRDMTVTLTQRMAATEAFAAEVAHELKNPLTSLRSAVETLPVARTDKARDSLLDVIAHDVRRIDRLISDISDASRLDSELTRARFAAFDLVHLLQHVVATEAELAAEREQAVTLSLRSPARAFLVEGNDSRLGQVFTNLLDNGRSFTPDGGRLTVTAQRFDRTIEVVVDDEGPGIDEAVLERIFERFYTDRPGQASFGNNSGLGLSICRQIVAAHGGEIFAENRYRTTLGPERDVAGARFTVRLPAAR